MSAEPAPRRRTHWLVWLFALFGLAGVAALIFIAVAIFSIGTPREPARVAGERPEESYSVRSAEPLAGTGLIRIDIAATTGRSGSGSYSSGGGLDDLRNILLLDRASGEARRILPDNSRRIVQAQFLPAPSDGLDGEEAQPPLYYVLLVERPGAEGADLLVGTLASGAQGYVMTGLDGVDSVWMHGPGTLGFVVRERLNLYYRLVDVGALRVVRTRRLVI